MSGQRWLLLVYRASAHDGALHKLGLQPSARDAACYYGRYALNAKLQLKRHIEALKALGLHGIARKVDGPSKPPLKATTARGKDARSERAAAKQFISAKKAMEIYQAGLIAGRTEARVSRESAKRKAELASQERHRQRAAAWYRTEQIAKGDP